MIVYVWWVEEESEGFLEGDDPVGWMGTETFCIKESYRLKKKKS